MGEQHRLSRLSLDSSVSNTSTASAGSLSNSWGGFNTSPKSSFLMRQFSTAGSVSASAPVNIPSHGGGSAFAGAGGADYSGFLRRNSMTGSIPCAAPGAGAAADAAQQHRMPALVRSLSKGLAHSLDFRH